MKNINKKTYLFLQTKATDFMKRYFISLMKDVKRIKVYRSITFTVRKIPEKYTQRSNLNA